jgi:hypothetical protein
VKRLKTKPLPPIPRKRRKAKNAMSNVRIAIKRAISRLNAGQRVAAMKVGD